MTNSIAELEGAEVLLVTGSNTTETHPQIARNILRAVDRGAKLIVIDPRRTDFARQAHIHLALRPGTDIALINAMIRFVLDRLSAMGCPDEHILTTLERHMKCGMGLCGHCHLDGKMVCVDGPVFTLAQLKTMDVMELG